MAVLRRFVVIALVGAAMLTAGCTQAQSQDPTALEGAQWTLSASSVTQTDLTGLGILAKFDGKQMTGFSGVNSYTGAYTAGEDGSFKAGPLASTMMAGPEKEMAAEAAYLKLVEAARSFEVADGKLTLTTDDGTTLTYQAAEPFSLAGSSWTVTGYNNGKEAVVGPLEGSELTLEFAADGTASGSGGVNTFSGPYESGETSIKIGPLASTMKAGPEELMAQEQQYVAALEASTEWEVANGVLTLRDSKGAMQVLASKK
jgi:heat shock protein HslJ